MNLKERIERDFIESYKARDEVKVSLLRMLKSAVKNAEISAKTTLSEEEIIRVLRREIKQRIESADEYAKAGREELAEKENAEAKLIEQYLPIQMEEDEIKKIVQEIISETGAQGINDMGRTIGAVMKRIGDQADGGTIARIVKESLQ